MKTVAYYTSAHGYGHGVRTCDIIRALRAEAPDVPVILTTDLPESFIRNRLPDEGVTLRPGSFDVGMVQLDSIRVDIPATLKRIQALYAERDALIRREADFLGAVDAGIVVADIPAIPLEAAGEARLPALAVGNFGWDWIYSEFADQDPGWQEVINQIAEGYGQADLLLRLPFAEEMKAFPRHKDLPLVASPGTPQREALAELTGASPEKTWVLLSFTTLDWSQEALDRVSELDDYCFFTVLPLAWEGPNLFAVDREQVAFSDVLASADVVVSKPGFGLVSECVVNEKPLVYVDRTEFLEYPILVEGIERYLKNVHLPQAKLYRGELCEALKAITSAPEPTEQMPTGGAELAVDRIMRFYNA
jgi:L-arabinokinase